MHKVWRQLRREGIEVVRCTVERLMRQIGLRRVVRGKAAKTTIRDKAKPCPLDRVNRQFRADRPNALWYRIASLSPSEAEAVYYDPLVESAKAA